MRAWLNVRITLRASVHDGGNAAVCTVNCTISISRVAKSNRGISCGDFDENSHEFDRRNFSLEWWWTLYISRHSTHYFFTFWKFCLKIWSKVIYFHFFFKFWSQITIVKINIIKRIIVNHLKFKSSLIWLREEYKIE